MLRCQQTIEGASEGDIPLVPHGKTREREIENIGVGAGEMSQRLRALPTVPEDPGTIPSTHTAAYKPLLTPVPGDPIALFWPL